MRRKHLTLAISFSVLLSILSHVCCAQDGSAQTLDAGQKKLMARAIGVTFIGNCGFLVQVDEKKVLFDVESPATAFDKAGLRNIYESLYANKPPFNDITCVFISHPHADHLGAREFVEYLRRDKDVRLYSTPGTRDELRKVDSLDFGQIERAVAVLDPYSTGIEEMVIEGIKTEVLGLYHAGAPDYVLKDLGFVLEIDGVRIFYLSDVDPGYEANLVVLRKWAAKKERIDLLFSPDVNLYANRWSPKGFEVVRNYINPERVIATHIDPRALDEAEKKVRENFPDVCVFRTCLEKKVFR